VRRRKVGLEHETGGWTIVKFSEDSIKSMKVITVTRCYIMRRTRWTQILILQEDETIGPLPKRRLEDWKIAF